MPAAGVVAEAMVALVLADAVLEKFGGDSVAETRRNVEGYLDHAEVPMTRDRDPGSCWSARWAPARPRSAGCSPSAGRARSATPTTTSRPAAGKPISDIFVDDGEAHFRALERAAVAAALADARRRAGPRRRRGARAGDPRARWPATRSSSSRSALADAVKRVGLAPRRPLLLGNVRGPASRRCSTSAPPLYREVATLIVRHRRPHARGGRRRGRRALVERAGAAPA